MPKIEREDTQRKILPRIVGITHIDSEFPKIVTHVFKNLNPNKIGLEVESLAPPAMPPGITREYSTRYLEEQPQQNSFFGKLAAIASMAKVPVKWIETPYSRHIFLTNVIKRRPRIVKEYGKKIANDSSVPKNIAEYIQHNPHVLFMQSLANYVTPDIHWISMQTAYPRSKVMAHKIMQEKWQKGDVVVVGSIHALEIQKILKEKYDRDVDVDNLTTMTSEETQQALRISKNVYELLKKRKQRRPTIQAAASILRAYEINHKVTKAGKSIIVTKDEHTAEKLKSLLHLFAFKNYALSDKVKITPVKKNTKTVAYKINFKK